jgi:hypothetical protein
MVTLLFYHSPIFSLIMMRVGAEDWELGQSVSLLAASCWHQGVLYGTRASDSCILVGWYPWWYNWLNFWLAITTCSMMQGRKLKNRKARNVGIRMGFSQENHCEMLFPRQFQESSNSHLCFLTVPWEVSPLEDLIELDSSGCCENDYMRAGPSKSQWKW